MQGSTNKEDQCLIDLLHVSAYRIPTSSPEADGTLSWDSTTLVLVELQAGGKTGIGYTYADASAAHYIDKKLRKVVEGTDAMHIPGIWEDMVQAGRNNGNSGIAYMAVSAVDNACWDLKAKLLDVPLSVLLGMVRDAMSIYGSGGFTSYTVRELQQQLSGWVEAGIGQVKMKIGQQPAEDLKRVSAAKEAIGTEATLFVDANGAYSAKQAIEKAVQFSGLDVSWFEEPVSSDDLSGLHFIREHAPAGMNIAAGEYGDNITYFKRMLAEEAVDVLQADATRCGGITGFLKAGYLCEAYHIPFSAHCAPALHLHPALALPSFYIAEYFHDHVRIEEMLFDGVQKPDDGVLKPDLSRPGLGLAFKQENAKKYKI